MSRIEYSEDGESSQVNLWRGNVNRSLQGKKGQAALKFLRESLLALPEKRLIAHAIARDGEVCAIGAAIVHEVADPLSKAYLMAELETVDEDEDTTDYAPKDFPRMVAWAVVEANDFTFGTYSYKTVTPEQRYELMLKWAEDRLAGVHVDR